ncbi:Protein spinster -like protein 1 [Halotydeus destructor]|nr:Protein spinster -like protein 1 [Halotydeus destructor]
MRLSAVRRLTSRRLVAFYVRKFLVITKLIPPDFTMPWSNGVSVAILCFINLINYMDRFTVAGVLKKVQNYYDLDDQEGGLLQTAFIVSYMVMAPLFGYLGDRYPRKYIIAGGVFFWSCMTYAGTIVPPQYPLLFYLARALVGVGEASYSTIAPTLIADLFVGEMRTRMLAIFFFAIPVGSGLGYVVGGQMATINDDWRYALKVTPPLGIISVLLTLFVLQEPVRGQSDGAASSESTTLKEDILYLCRVKSYIWSTLGFTSVCFAVGALSWWAPKYMASAYEYAGITDMAEDKVALIFGVITCVSGILGVVIGSGGAQYYRRYNSKADPLICGFGVLLSVPFSFLGLSLAYGVPALSWISIFITITALCINWTLCADILLYVISPNRRAFAQAMQILFAHLFGDAASPFVVGTIADAIKRHEGDLTPAVKYHSMQYALYSTSVVLVLGGLAFLYTAKYIDNDREVCKRQTQGQRLSSSDDIQGSPRPTSGRFDEDSLAVFPPSNFTDSDQSGLVDHIA